MPSSGLRGPYPLANKGIDENVRRTSPGAYALGHLREKDRAFIIRYVGRSDDDVRDRLKGHVGDYTRFKYEYYSTVKEAFEKECHLYHDFNPRDNEIHPARPANCDWECPVCDAFD